MRERVHTFGDHGNLVGVYTPAADADRERPTVVYLTAGLLHRVGPNRLHVELARELAAVGYPGFRFDMTGIGDSAALRSLPSGLDRYAEDIREALDFLAAEHGSRTFVLAGLCSGADYAHIGAVADERVVGAVLLDGYGYPTRESRVRHYAPKLADPRKVAGFLVRRARRHITRDGVKSGEPVDVFARELPPRDDVARDLAGLARRGVRMYFVYSGGQTYVNYRGQLRDMFPDIDTSSFHVDYLPHTDHTFMLGADRTEVRDRIRAWLGRELPGEVRAEPAPADEPDSETEEFVF